MFVCVCGVGALGGVDNSQIRYQKRMYKSLGCAS